MGYSAAMIFDFAGGILVERLGWYAFFAVIVFCMAAATIAQCIYQFLDMKHRKLKQEAEKQKNSTISNGDEEMNAMMIDPETHQPADSKLAPLPIDENVQVEIPPSKTNL